MLKRREPRESRVERLLLKLRCSLNEAGWLESNSNSKIQCKLLVFYILNRFDMRCTNALIYKEVEKMLKGLNANATTKKLANFNILVVKID